MTGDEWTPNLDNTLSSMKAMGCSYRDIGRVIGKSRTATQKRWLRLKLGAMTREQWRERERLARRPVVSDADKYLARIFSARPEGFPVLQVQPFRRAA